jgi:hypothetical protein
MNVLSLCILGLDFFVFVLSIWALWKWVIVEDKKEE